MPFPDDRDAQRTNAEVREPIEIRQALVRTGSFDLIEVLIAYPIIRALNAGPDVYHRTHTLPDALGNVRGVVIPQLRAGASPRNGGYA